MNMKKKLHGGKRKNAGRKPKEPTKTMRIPETLVPKITAMIEKHKAKPFHGPKAEARGGF